ncbi:MAG TPA: class I SAM-dependent methyltransferase [Candidatus Brocadiaceae bacterium]|nr:class I SAM-dependent methyltransferase [Candidatus Brocadiaceae bacterium]
MLKTIKSIIQREQFFPWFLGFWVNPFYFARKGLYENISILSNYIRGDMLDIGCGQKPYEKLFNSSRYVGLEIDTIENRKNKNADYFYDGITFPFRDNEFDSVIANEVFEHVFNPAAFLNEIYRVLKPNGMLLMTVPFVWDEHEQPFDYARYSSFGLKHLLEESGFEVIEHKKSVCDIRVIFQLFNCYIYKKTVTKNVYANLFITAFLLSPFNILGELLSKVLPKNEDLYLDNIILTKKKISG